MVLPRWRNLADALGLGPSGRKALQVQLLSSAQIKKMTFRSFFILMGCVLLDTNWEIYKSN